MGSDTPTAQRGATQASHRHRPAVRTAVRTAVRAAVPAVPRPAVRLVVWGLAGAALLYNSWIVETAVPTGLDPRHSYVSELYAAGRSSRGLFAALELSCAALLVTGAVAGGLLRRRQGGGAGWWALAGFGVCSVADVLFPLDCAPSLEPGCSAVHPVHTVTSALVHFFLFASMASLTWWARRLAAPGGWGAVARWGLPLMGAALLSAVATVGPLLGHPGWHGVPQRLHLLLVGVWLLLLAYGVRADANGTRPRPGEAQDTAQAEPQDTAQAEAQAQAQDTAGARAGSPGEGG